MRGPHLLLKAGVLKRGQGGPDLLSTPWASKRVQGDPDLFKMYLCTHGIIGERSEPLSRVFDDQLRDIYIYGDVRTYVRL